MLNISMIIANPVEQNPPLYIPNAFKNPEPNITLKYLFNFNAGGFTNIWNNKGGSNYNNPGQAICVNS